MGWVIGKRGRRDGDEPTVVALELFLEVRVVAPEPAATEAAATEAASKIEGVYRGPEDHDQRQKTQNLGHALVGSPSETRQHDNGWKSL